MGLGGVNIPPLWSFWEWTVRTALVEMTVLVGKVVPDHGTASVLSPFSGVFNSAFVHSGNGLQFDYLSPLGLKLVLQLLSLSSQSLIPRMGFPGICL